jgi:thiamine-monophosphate kinase
MAGTSPQAKPSAPRQGQVRGEEDVQRLFAPLAAGFSGAFGLADDCALLAPEPGTELVLKTDPIAEGVHFLPDDAPEDIAFKALAVNVSDLAAKAATPVGYLMALAFPLPPTRAWLKRFAAGLKAAQERFGFHLLGGDTDRRPGPLSIDITVIGSVAKGAMVRRGTAGAGQAIFVSGTLGDAGLGLALRKDASRAAAWRISPSEAEFLRRRWLRPEPRLALGEALRQCAAAAMDVSDGLIKDLGRMVKASRCGARIHVADVPLSQACRKVLEAEPRLSEEVLAGGDDYEILAAVPLDKEKRFRARAAAAGVAVTRIGHMRRGAGVRIVGLDGRPVAPGVTGFDHFRSR